MLKTKSLIKLSILITKFTIFYCHSLLFIQPHNSQARLIDYNKYFNKIKIIINNQSYYSKQLENILLRRINNNKKQKKEYSVKIKLTINKPYVSVANNRKLTNYENILCLVNLYKNNKLLKYKKIDITDKYISFIGINPESYNNNSNRLKMIIINKMATKILNFVVINIEKNIETKKKQDAN